jgi:hypothetical protein
MTMRGIPDGSLHPDDLVEVKEVEAGASHAILLKTR